MTSTMHLLVVVVTVAVLQISDVTSAPAPVSKKCPPCTVDAAVNPICVLKMNVYIKSLKRECRICMNLCQVEGNFKSTKTAAAGTDVQSNPSLDNTLVTKGSTKNKRRKSSKYSKTTSRPSKRRRSNRRHRTKSISTSRTSLRRVSKSKVISKSKVVKGNKNIEAKSATFQASTVRDQAGTKQLKHQMSSSGHQITSKSSSQTGKVSNSGKGNTKQHIVRGSLQTGRYTFSSGNTNHHGNSALHSSLNNRVSYKTDNVKSHATASLNYNVASQHFGRKSQAHSQHGLVSADNMHDGRIYENSYIRKENLSSGQKRKQSIGIMAKDRGVKSIGVSVKEFGQGNIRGHSTRGNLRNSAIHKSRTDIGALKRFSNGESSLLSAQKQYDGTEIGMNIHNPKSKPDRTTTLAVSHLRSQGKHRQGGIKFLGNRKRSHFTKFNNQKQRQRPLGLLDNSRGYGGRISVPLRFYNLPATKKERIVKKAKTAKVDKDKTKVKSKTKVKKNSNLRSKVKRKYNMKASSGKKVASLHSTDNIETAHYKRRGSSHITTDSHRYNTWHYENGNYHGRYGIRPDQFEIAESHTGSIGSHRDYIDNGDSSNDGSESNENSRRGHGRSNNDDSDSGSGSDDNSHRHHRRRNDDDSDSSGGRSDDSDHRRHRNDDNSDSSGDRSDDNAHGRHRRRNDDDSNSSGSESDDNNYRHHRRRNNDDSNSSGGRSDDSGYRRHRRRNVDNSNNSDGQGDNSYQRGHRRNYDDSNDSDGGSDDEQYHRNYGGESDDNDHRGADMESANSYNDNNSNNIDTDSGNSDNFVNTDSDHDDGSIHNTDRFESDNRNIHGDHDDSGEHYNEVQYSRHFSK